MIDYFEEYKKAKSVLCELTIQNYFYNLTKEQANKLEIKYDSNDIYNSLNKVSSVYHRYIPEGLCVWNILGIEKPIVTFKEMNDVSISINNESVKKAIDILNN